MQIEDIKKEREREERFFDLDKHSVLGGSGQKDENKQRWNCFVVSLAPTELHTNHTEDNNQWGKCRSCG